MRRRVKKTVAKVNSAQKVNTDWRSQKKKANESKVRAIAALMPPAPGSTWLNVNTNCNLILMRFDGGMCHFEGEDGSEESIPLYHLHKYYRFVHKGTLKGQQDG